MHTFKANQLVTQATGGAYAPPVPVLSPRLQAVAAKVRRGSCVADIGCDHGKLAVYLALQGIAPKVIAADVRPLPLAKARALVAQTGCAGSVECRLGNGLFVLQPAEANDIVIAGMSGETMIEILQAQPHHWCKGLRLLLVPVTRSELLRGWLLRNGFALLEEAPVEDTGRVYPVMVAEYTGERQQPTPLFCETGRLDLCLPQAQVLLKARLTHLKNRTKAPLSAQEMAQLQALIKEVEQCIQ